MSFEELLGESTEIESEAPQHFPGDTQPTTKTAIDRAEKEGLEVVYPGPKQLQIDVDRPDQFKTFLEHLAILTKYLDVKEMKCTESKTPGHRHITLTCGRFISVPERICLQALLGSDLKREVLGFIMMKNGEPKPTLFLEKKEK